MQDRKRGRVSIVETNGEMLITIPPKREVFATVFLAIWLIFWAAGVFIVASILLFGDGSADIFLTLWLIFWVVGGVIALATLIWKLVGKEYVAITADVIVVSRSVPFWNRKTTGNMIDVRNLRVAPVKPADDDTRSAASGLLAQKTDGAIHLTFGQDTVGFGLDLEPDQARNIIDRIVQSYPKIGPRS